MIEKGIKYGGFLKYCTGLHGRAMGSVTINCGCWELITIDTVKCYNIADTTMA
ncbi:MAG: hypothetical protein SFH39_05575 [Candidatus Magnetobacterium sp. LHC-1]